MCCDRYASQAAAETMSTYYNLSEQVHVAATVDPSAGVVCLWMGVRVARERSCA